MSTAATNPVMSVAPPVGGSRVGLLAELLHPRGNATLTLGALVVGVVGVPVLLLLLFRLVDPAPGSWLLGLVLGLLVDLLVAVLLVVLVLHRTTGRRLRDHRRALATVEAQTGRLETRTARLDTTLATLTTGRDRSARLATRGVVADATLSLGNRLQATQNLFALVAPCGPVPQLVGYVASPDVLLVLVGKFLALRPSLTVECGSGTSTLFLALAAQQHGVDGRIVSLENNLEYAEGTRALLAEHGVGHLAEVRHAPLTPTSLPDHEGPWYDPAALEDLHDIGLAFVDGPPGTIGPQARYPMVPLLVDRFAPRCAILLDDANRREEQGVTERWTTRLDGFGYRFLPLTRGAGLFERDV